MGGYIELRCHSAFSFGDGACTPESLVERASALGYGGLGLADHADLGGAIRFALEARSQGVRPVVGAELLVDGYPTAFLARDARGFRNLAALVTRARVGDWRSWLAERESQGREVGTIGGATSIAAGREGFAPIADRRSPIADASRGGPGSSDAGASRGQPGPRAGATPRARPRRDPTAIGDPRSAIASEASPPTRGRPGVTFDDLAGHAAGLHVLTGPASGELATLLRSQRPDEAVFQLSRWRELFPGRLAVEVQLHHVSGEESALAGALVELAERQGVPWVATNDPRYLDGGGRLVHDLLTALRADLDVNTAASWGVLHPNGEWRLKSPAEMAALWKGREAGLEESVRIASECGFELGWLRPPLPRFPVPAGHDDDSWLRQLTLEGARERWGELDARQRGQLDHELGVIARLGFSGFFLVMWDAVRFAREQGILCQGRGSAANSAVAYCLGITAVDPVRHGLLFERFLSEVRTDGLTEAPDIDVDFEMHRREEVLDYMYRRYGRRHAAITCTSQVFHAPTAIQDCMRALGYPAEQAFSLSKRLHHREPSEGADELESGLAARFDLDLGDARGRALLSALRALDGVPRLRSTHPGGFVLSSEPLGHHLPIEETAMGRTIIQFDKDDLDAAGVPKFDFLGLGGLSVIKRAFEAIEVRTGESLRLYDLPTDDAATYDLISRGETVGMFQIESRAQIQSILRTRPERLYDIVVQVALIRPGPIQARFVHPYTRRRLGQEPVTYADPRLKPILERTYGIPIFQEQAMAISMALGGFSAAEADELRRAMGNKRKLPKLHAALQRLEARMVRDGGLPPETAGSIVEDLYSFSNYGFPESHAWSFALIAYATAYLKAHYPAEFLLGLLNSWPMGFYPPATLVHDARRLGVVVRPPCLRDGEWECTMEAPLRGATDDRRPTTDDVGGHEPRRAAFLRPGTTGRASAARVAEDAAKYAAPERRRSSVVGHRSASEASLRRSAGRRAAAPGPAVRIGWKHIRGLGERAQEALQRARGKGAFASVEDVVRRAELSRTEALHLARAGAFEAFEPGRRRAAWEALRAAGDTLPLAPARPLPFDPEELEGPELIFLDYLSTGICTHGHPIEHLRGRLDAAGVTSSAGLDGLADGAPVVTAGLVVVRQHPATARGTVFLLLEDEFGYLNIIVPPPVFAAYRETASYSPFLLVQGRFEREDRVRNIVAKRFRTLKSNPGLAPAPER